MISDTPTAAGTLRSGGRAHTPQQVARITLVGSWIFTGGNFFFLLPLFFAFFFLQQANVDHMWQPKGIHPPSLVLGTVVAALVIIGVAVAQSGLGNLTSQRTLNAFTNRGRLAALVLVAAIVVQIWQLSHVGYGIDSGAYASCFFVMQIVLTIEVGVLALWVLSLANRASYESQHPIAMPSADAAVEVATPISALAHSYQLFALFVGSAFVLAWVVCYFL